MNTEIYTIIVEDHDLHDAAAAKLDSLGVVTLDKAQLQEELLVRLPLVVVHNCHTDLKIEILFF